MSTRSLTRFARSPLSLSALLCRLNTMRATRRQRLALSQLDAAALADIGVTAAQAKAESLRPVWDVTPSWRD
jgi:uncharacterized protein YjiS (DUF1127 family)